MVEAQDLDGLVGNVSHFFFGQACNFTTLHMGQSFNPKSSTTTKTMLGCAHARKGA
jgi:glycine cleavage system regulatory protein